MIYLNSNVIWTPINDYPGYSVSSNGFVRNDKRGRLRSIWRDRTGYCFVTLRQNKKPRACLVHRLVAINFLGAHPSLQVNHIDGNKNNNSLSNLEWVTAKANMFHRFHVLNKGNNNKLPVLRVEDGRIFDSLTEAANAVGDTVGNICRACKEPHRTAKGFHWQYFK